MTKKVKNSKKAKDVNLFYINGQAVKTVSPAVDRNKQKEREKRIKQNKLKREQFDEETEEVINMTNKNKIRNEKEKRKRLEEKEIKRKSKNKKIKLVLKILLLLAIILGGIVFALVSPIFNIKEIQVMNNNHISTEEIISLSELKLDENIFRFMKYGVENKIESNAYIEIANIHRKLPGTIQIEVKERDHNFSVDFLGQYAYINNQGYILEISEESNKKIIIQGITTSEDQIKIGNRLCDEDLEKLQDIIKIVNIAKEYNLDTKITSIEISNTNEYNMYIEEEQKRVYLGDNSNLSNKMLYVNAIIEQEKGNKGEIFANGDLNNGFRVYFRFDV